MTTISRRRTTLALYAAVLVAISGCNELSQPETAKVERAEVTPSSAPSLAPASSVPENLAIPELDRASDPPSKAEPTRQELAEAKLRIALDSWAFGDSYEEFEGNHPDVMVFELDWRAHRYTLIGYEVGQSRIEGFTKDDGTPSSMVVFAVTLTYTNMAGQEVKRKKQYNVYDPDGDEEWQIVTTN